ncbi:hypothetical protein NE452_02000 [Paeniclostridium sordellii]|uniref:hypothetical protein n=1 Tax=Paraclostridium sordellii TaxID=1505 RepID=UPI0005DF036F|nr:hypothetical protein [Paeniclostridium sordellii]MCQ4696283.1 hypothetical protein [Paeniclostridium sordellii]CEN81842.1 Uncharacterised protein [[Clostridium] sordellii] [Paeniclostridium sordellii]CEO08607.1 Uncharacterised protein [[Clostridium] sordellii] [Paeniclostridium sordellii]
MPFCILCGSKLVWQSDFDAEDYNYTKDGVVGIYQCSNSPKCGAIFEIVDLFEEDEDYNNTDVYDYRFIKYTLDND